MLGWIVVLMNCVGSITPPKYPSVGLNVQIINKYSYFSGGGGGGVAYRWGLLHTIKTCSYNIQRSNESPPVLVVDASSKSPLFVGGGSSWMATRKWKVMKLQLKMHVKDQQMTTLLLKDSLRSGGIPRGSGDHLENGGRTTLCLNKVKNEPM